jgi:hypothetical protein
MVCVSFDLMMKEEGDRKVNGFGRDSPNVFPALSDPSGRLSFDVTNPIGFIKEIIGPVLFGKCVRALCCLACTSILVAGGYMIFT